MNQNRTIPHSSRRSGGREARRTLRAAPLAEDLRPVRAGLEGGNFKPLDAAAVKAVDATVYQILEEIGLSQAPDTGIKYMTEAGAVLGDDGRLRFPRALVEHTLAICGRHITLHGQDPKHDLLLSGSRVHYGTAGAAVHVVDVAKNEYRESYLADIYDAARIVEQMDNIHFFQRPMVARDIPDPADLDFNTVYAAIKGTTKHVGVSFTEAEYMKPVFEMLHMVAGGEDKWRARPFVSNSNCFVVPPLRFATESCLVMEEAVRNGMPVLLLSAGQAGATAPASIAGAVAQALAEVVAGLIYVNAMKPGHPCICGTWPFVSDLRTGAMSGGSGEQGLLTSACAQMLQYYDLPGGAAAGMADAKMPDAQSGYEKGSTLVMAGLSGLNMVYEAAGMHASLLGFCLDSLIIDNDMLGQCMRCVRGIEVNETTLGVQVMKDVCMGGPGHYLGHDQTIKLMQTEYIYPVIADRSSPKEWEELGKPNLLDTARKRKEEILESPHPLHIPDALDQDLRARFNVLL
ncbi:MAG: trimethylamine methyltransferase family protein [Proteobacteria bacterium]|nr:trimethylamine methyltransferase family protein [Pseudomonadota bacterium]MDA0960417.1 trimethylamine methyltransferase family protein [Pseudomonadota bacterium]MDA1151964.1 trimethylamine methyltransferase family protein [Pseudomonadota bacterium]